MEDESVSLRGMQAKVDKEMGTAAQGLMPNNLESYGPRAQGLVLVISGFGLFVGFIYAVVVSKFLPLSENQIIRAIQSDRYYCFLVPLTIPVLVVAVYFHWLCMKLFKHA
jgi:phosphatidylinositol glycan anchor class Y biosynthesis protein